MILYFWKMKRTYLLILAVGIFLTVTMCKTEELMPTKARHLKPAEATGFHPPITLTIAWYPYENEVLKRTSEDEWKVIEVDTGRTGAIPVILIEYSNGQDSLWLDMNTESELLGKLLKHSLMTQEPIKRPFSEYLETASCTKCHPADVEVDFDR